MIDQKSATQAKAKKKTTSRSSQKTSVLTSFDIANKYASDVVAGRIVACKWVKKACKRHLDDLERSKTAAFRYKFDKESANRPCRFIEALPHTKDDFENRASNGARFELQPWQKFIVCSLFGWIDKLSGRYRFREAYIEVPRKNGKSFLAAGIGLYKFAADNEYGAEVYSGATSEKQAWEIFRPSRDIALRTPTFRKTFGVTVNAKSLTILKNGSRFEPVIGKPGDGASPSCALVDEFHEHQSDELVETMRTGMGARKNPLLFQITTAGSDRSSPCYSRHLDVKKMLEGSLVNERLFGIIYTIDDDDDWAAPESLEKSNPNLGFSVEPEGLYHDQEAAVQSARLQNSFKTKHQNVWVNTATSWMNMVLWDAAKDPTLRLEDFNKQECWLGLDLAAKTDIASVVKVFRRLIDGKWHFYAFHSAYLNEAKVAETGNESYRAWAHGDRLTVTPGEETDYLRIADDIVQDAKQFSIQQIPHDPRDAQSILQFVRAHKDWDQKVDIVEIIQSKANYTPPMRELEAAVASGRFHHDGDPVLAWMISNVVVRPDSLELLFPRKQREEDKIDGAAALLMALGRAMLIPTTGTSVYESRGLVII